MGRRCFSGDLNGFYFVSFGLFEMKTSVPFWWRSDGFYFMGFGLFEMKTAVPFHLCKVVSMVRTEQSCLYGTWMMAMVSCLRLTLMVGCDVL